MLKNQNVFGAWGWLFDAVQEVATVTSIFQQASVLDRAEATATTGIRHLEQTLRSLDIDPKPANVNVPPAERADIALAA